MGTNGHEREIAVPLAETVFGSLETPASDLPPLSDAIDLDALENLVPADGPPDVTVAFSYEGLRVFVHSGQVVCVRSISGDDWPNDPDPTDRR